jgi:LuxR family maltose regulon positive regulatory protein/serine/threonine-protein kinase PknK
VPAERIRQLLAARRVAEARWIAQDLRDGGGRHGGIGLAIDQIRTAALAAVLSAEGDHDGAQAPLEELIPELDGRGQVRASVAAAVALTAVAERATCRMAAERHLASALSHTPPAGLRQPILDGGPEVAAVLARLVARAEAGTWPGIGPPTAAGALAELLTRPAGVPPSNGVTGVNARELAVLRMLDVGRSNQQISHTLGVTVNIVKWYLKNIYAKLGATSRAEAVPPARRGGLLG